MVRRERNYKALGIPGAVSSGGFYVPGYFCTII